jgi:outer membrane protein assembly factor BamB/enterochelin esterase-like enzyme
MEFKAHIPHSAIGGSVIRKTSIGILILSITTFLFGSEWPSMRGPSQNGRVDGGNFAGTEGALGVAWRATIGPGYSGVTIVNGKAVTLFSDGKQDYAIAFDANSGKELWRYKIADTYKGHDGSHDGPIATPVIADGRVFGFGAAGHLFALDHATGKQLWTINVAETLGAQAPFYGFGASPVVAGNVLVLELGAKEGKAIAAFDVATGERKWTLGDDVISYQTPIAIQFNGKNQIVAVGDKKLFGIDSAAGKILWEYAYQGDDRAMTSASLIPIPAEEGQLLLKNKMDSSTLVKLVNGPDGKITIEPVWTAGVFKSTYSPPVFYDGYFYGYNGRILTCVDAKNGELKWRSRPPGDGLLIIVDGNLVVQTKAGTLHVAKASPEGWKEKSQLNLFPATSWTAPSFANGSLFARSQGEIARLEWKTQSTASAASDAPAVPANSRFGNFLTQLNSASDKKAAVDQFMSSITSFPLVEWPDQVHFLYRGDATDMGIVGDMIGDRREDPMKRVPGTDLFYYSIRLEPDARINYYFVKNYDERIPDPQNPHLTYDLRNTPNSWVSMPSWKEPAYLDDASEERRGRLETKEMKSKSRPAGSIQYEVYLPAGYDKGVERYPSIYLFDGPSAKSMGMVVNSFDNLMGVSARPSIVVLIGDIKTGEKPLEDEIEEFNTQDKMVATELVQTIDTNYRTIADPSMRAIVGSGFSTLDALFITFSHPGIFGSIACQSAFLMEEIVDPLKKSMRTATEQPLRMYMDWGLYDMRATREGWDSVKSNREFNTFLRSRGYYPAGGEAHDGTGWSSWRNRTDKWLSALFPMTQ